MSLQSRCADTGADVVAGTRAAKVMMAVLAGTNRIPELVEATGLPRVTVHAGLVDLRELGLIAWETGKQGTIRPTCRLVA